MWPLPCGSPVDSWVLFFLSMLFIRSCLLEGASASRKLTTLWRHRQAFETWLVKKSAIGLLFTVIMILILFIYFFLRYTVCSITNNMQVTTRDKRPNIETKWDLRMWVSSKGWWSKVFVHTFPFLLLALIFLVPGYLEMVGRLRLYPLHISWICTCPTSPKVQTVEVTLSGVAWRNFKHLSVLRMCLRSVWRCPWRQLKVFKGIVQHFGTCLYCQEWNDAYVNMRSESAAGYLSLFELLSSKNHLKAKSVVHLDSTQKWPCGAHRGIFLLS